MIRDILSTIVGYINGDALYMISQTSRECYYIAFQEYIKKTRGDFYECYENGDTISIKIIEMIYIIDRRSANKRAGRGGNKQYIIDCYSQGMNDWGEILIEACEIKYKEKIKEYISIIEYAIQKGVTLADIDCGFINAGNIEIAKKMIAYGATEYQNALSKACYNGNTELVEYLISSGRMTQDSYNRGLASACRAKNISLVRRMLELGATEVNMCIYDEEPSKEILEELIGTGLVTNWNEVLYVLSEMGESERLQEIIEHIKITDRNFPIDYRHCITRASGNEEIIGIITQYIPMDLNMKISAVATGSDIARFREILNDRNIQFGDILQVIATSRNIAIIRMAMGSPILNKRFQRHICRNYLYIKNEIAILDYAEEIMGEKMKWEIIIRRVIKEKRYDILEYILKKGVKYDFSISEIDDFRLIKIISKYKT